MSKNNMVKRNQLKTKYNYDGQYIVIPAIIYDNTDLNATDKITLSMIHGFKSNKGNTWNGIRTSTIADILGLERSTINTSIKKLKDLELLEERYAVARYRVFKSLLPDTTDFKALITSDVLRNKDITNTYKITIGVIIAYSLGEKNTIGGFNFNRIQALADELNLSVSSVYRHLQHLTKLQVMEQKEYARYTLKPINSYVSHNLKNTLRVINHQKAMKEPEPEDDINYIDPSVSDAINRIYNRI